MDKSLIYKAKMDFDRAKTKAFFIDFFKKILNDNNSLLEFDEVKYMLSPVGMSYKGVQTIPLKNIVGSEGRYQDFDRNFLPKKDNTRSRWESIDIANLKEIILPPISVYKIDKYYFVRDGNHRVSVAREKGQEFIDAEVIELYVDIKLDEDNLNPKGLLIAEGEKFFNDKTQFNKLYPDKKIKLTNPWGYYRLVEHINTYKYFICEKLGYEPEWRSVVQKWYNELYLNVVNLIKKKNILKYFPERTEGDLYIWIMDHWHFLKEKYGDVALEKAIDDYTKRFGSRIINKIKEFFSFKFLKIKK